MPISFISDGIKPQNIATNRWAIATLAACKATLLDYQDIGAIIILQKAKLRMSTTLICLAR